MTSAWGGSGAAAEGRRTCCFGSGNVTGQLAMAVESREMQDAVAGSQQLAGGRGRGRGCGGWCRGSLGRARARYPSLDDEAGSSLKVGK
jgi:hypothetical protein